MAANAHINSDLSFALKNTIKNGNFYSDYQKIEQIIDGSIKESVLWVNRKSPVFSFIDHKLISIYELIIKHLLKEWRKAAWNNFLKFKKNDKSNIELIAARKAREIEIISYVIPY